MKRGGFIFTAQQMAKSFSTKDRELSYHRQTKSTYCNDDCPSLQKPLQLLSSFRKLLLDVPLYSSIIIPCTLLKKPAESNKMSFPQSIQRMTYFDDKHWINHRACAVTVTHRGAVRGKEISIFPEVMLPAMIMKLSREGLNVYPPFSICAFQLYRQPLHPVGPSVKFHRAMRNVSSTEQCVT